MVLGHTQVVSASVVNAHGSRPTLRILSGPTPGVFQPGDVGVKMHSYPPGDQFPLTVTNYFNINAGGATKRTSHHKTFAIADDVTLVRGSHQLGFGANVRRWKFDTVSTSRTGGSWTVDGSATGHALADLLTGRVSRFEIGGPNVLDIHNWYAGAYAQDAWRVEPGDDQCGRAVGRTSASRSRTTRS